MNELTTAPDSVGDFGQDFNYAVWTPGTEIILSNVMWSADYRDVPWFDTTAEVDEYLLTRPGGVPRTTINRMTYVAPNRPVRIDIPYASAIRYNYLRVSNGLTPIDGDEARVYYYFVQDARYVAPNTTELIVQLDVWTTFSRYLGEVRGYLERGHLTMGGSYTREFNTDYALDTKESFHQWLTQPEGFDLGGEYLSFLRDEVEIATARWVDGKYTYDIMIVSTIQLHGDLGTVNNPKVITAQGSMAEYLPNGCNIYIVSEEERAKVMDTLSLCPWAAQGIVSITAVPDSAVKDLVAGSMTVQIGPGNVKILDRGSQVKTTMHTLAKGWTGWHPHRAGFNQRYFFLDKFLTYPYTVIEVSTYTGTPIVLKPEQMYYMNQVDLVKRSHYVPPNPRITFSPLGYGMHPHHQLKPMGPYKKANSGELVDDYGESFNIMTGIFNLPTFSLPNSGYLNYMAANANTIAYQHQSADWSQQRALAGNQVAYDQASMGMSTMQQMTELGIGAATAQMNLANQTTSFRGIQSGVNAAIGGVGRGGMGVLGAGIGMANAAAGAAIDINQNTQSTAISNQLARSQTGAALSQSGFNRDTNKAYADWAAKGDYSNAIAGINARVQDARAIPPTTAGQVGGDAFLLATHRWACTVTIKTIPPGAMQMIGEYWLRYGYAINTWYTIPRSSRFGEKRFQVMDKFTYWKFKETYIEWTFIPEHYRQTLRGIFEKGVTVWHKPDYMAGYGNTFSNRSVASDKYWI